MWGGGVVKGWAWGSGRHTNTVVILLHWSICSILSHFFAKTKVADPFSAKKIGDEGL